MNVKIKGVFHLRKIDIPEIEDIALGAALLGAGGGVPQARSHLAFMRSGAARSAA